MRADNADQEQSVVLCDREAFDQHARRFLVGVVVGERAVVGKPGEGPGRTMVMAAPTRENLQRLGTLLADGTLRIPIQATYPLARAPEALAALAGQHTQGKLAIELR